MKKLITLTVALLTTTQVFAEDKSIESTFDSSKTKCFSFGGQVGKDTSIDVTSLQGANLNDVDITVKSLGKGKNGKWTPFDDQDWVIELLYKGSGTSIPFTINVKNITPNSKGQGPDLNFNSQGCTNF